MRAIVFLLVMCLALAACGDDDDAPAASPTPAATATVTVSPTPAPPTPPTAVPVTPTQAPPTAPASEPAGFPIRPDTVLGVVQGEVGSRQLVFNGPIGPTALDYATNDQPSSDPVVANRSGWNCETHYEYENAPAVDFYIQIGTPILATMDGIATLNIISVNNDFDRYGVDREPYLGNPDRSRAPYSPFPGPSSGEGVYVRVENDSFATEYGHMEISETVDAVPASAFVGGYSPSSDYASIFAGAPEPRVITTVARWEVHRGDVIGMSGDSGYSEGPHVHYTVNRSGGPLRCPTTEAGFTDGGWLFR